MVLLAASLYTKALCVACWSTAYMGRYVQGAKYDKLVSEVTKWLLKTFSPEQINAAYEVVQKGIVENMHLFSRVWTK